MFPDRRTDGPDAAAVRRLMDLLDAGLDSGPAECAPPLDVVEHGDRIEITLDVPGVARDDIRVIFGRGTLAIAGRKTPVVCERAVAFHVAERTFGRFVRAVTLQGALDAGRATASLANGELRVVLPRIDERRGGDIVIEVTGGARGE